MKGSICAVLAATAVAVSCKKQETVNPSLVTSTVEVMLGNPTTKAFGVGKTETWEQTLHNVAMFVYESGQDVCAYQRQFTDYEVGKGKAVFAIPNVKENTTYDFYAVANCDFSAEMSNYPTQPGVTRTDLLAKCEGVLGSGSSSSNSSFGNLQSYQGAFTAVTGGAMRGKDSGSKNVGFIMSGMKSEKTPVAGDNKPTRVTVPLKRTVAKVEIEATTTAAFHTSKYPGSTLTVTGAKLIKLANRTALIRPTTFTTAALGSVVELAQSPAVVAVNDNESKNNPYELFRNLFYIYENSDGTTELDAAFAPVLVLTADFDFDGDSNTKDDISHITYNIKLAGEAAATGAGSSPKPGDANFGLFVRNGSYFINISINGLTENEVVAQIEVKDWEPLRTQNVEIGNKN